MSIQSQDAIDTGFAAGEHPVEPPTEPNVASSNLFGRVEKDLAVRVDARSEALIAFSVRPRRWGAHGIGPVAARTRDALRLPTWEGRLGARVDLRAFPREERLRELVVPLRTQPFLGTHVARARARGSSSRTSARFRSATGYGRSIGRRIPALHPARPARLAIALAAILLRVALAALVITDAGAASQLAWLGAGAAALSVAVGIVARSPAPVHAAVAVLGVMFLERHDVRLLLAPLYGASLLIMEDLAIRTMELDGAGEIASEVIAARLGATLAVAAIGACRSAVAAPAVTAALPRSVALTAVGALAAVAAFIAIVLLARRRFGPSAADPHLTPPRLASQGPPSRDGAAYEAIAREGIPCIER